MLRYGCAVLCHLYISISANLVPCQYFLLLMPHLIQPPALMPHLIQPPAADATSDTAPCC